MFFHRLAAALWWASILVPFLKLCYKCYKFMGCKMLTYTIVGLQSYYLGNPKPNIPFLKSMMGLGTYC